MTHWNRIRNSWSILLAIFLLIFVFVSTGVFSIMWLSFIPAKWLFENSIYMALGLMPFMLYSMISLPDSPYFKAAQRKKHSVMIQLFCVAFLFFVTKDFVAYALPWTYTKVFGHETERTFHIVDVLGNDRKFCHRVQLKNIAGARVCAQKLQLNDHPYINQEVTFYGKSSIFGFLIYEAKIDISEMLKDKAMNRPAANYSAEEIYTPNEIVCSDVKVEMGVLTNDC